MTCLRRDREGKGTVHRSVWSYERRGEEWLSTLAGQCTCAQPFLDGFRAQQHHPTTDKYPLGGTHRHLFLFYSVSSHPSPKFFFPFPSLFIITHPFFSFSNNNLHEWSSPPSSLTLHFPNPNYIILFIIYGIMLLILSSLKPMPKILLWTQTHSKFSLS